MDQQLTTIGGQWIRWGKYAYLGCQCGVCWFQCVVWLHNKKIIPDGLPDYHGDCLNAFTLQKHKALSLLKGNGGVGSTHSNSVVKTDECGCENCLYSSTNIMSK
jgi:hypothetical protein